MLYYIHGHKHPDSMLQPSCIMITSRMLSIMGRGVSEVADSTEARSQSLIFTEHSNTDKMKKRRTVADSVANVGESGDRDRCLGTSVAYLGVNTRP